MRDISKEITSYKSAKDVAKELHIKPVTLKKYSLLIEKMSKGNVMFERSGDRSRLYTDTDVTLIRRTLDTRDQNDLSYKKAVESVLKEEKIMDATDDMGNVATPATLENDLDGTIKSLFAAMNEQNAQINQLVKANKDLAKSNEKLANQVQELFEERKLIEEYKKEDQKQKRWWSFFNNENRK